MFFLFFNSVQTLSAHGNPWNRRGSVHEVQVTVDTGHNPIKVTLKVSCCLVAKSYSDFFVTPWTVAHQDPLSQGRILELVAVSFSRASSQLRDQTHLFCINR